MSRFSRRQRCRRRQHLLSWTNANLCRVLSQHFLQHLACNSSLLCAARASLPVCQGPSYYVLMKTPLTGLWFGHCFQVRCPGTWQESCWMNVGSRRGSASWFACKARSKWAHASAVLLDTKLGCFQGLGAWVSSQLAISRVMAVQSRVLALWACHIQGLGFVPVGLNQAGRVQDFYWKNDPEGWQVFRFWWVLKFEMHTGLFEGFGPEPTWFQNCQVFLMQPCGLFQLLSCSHLAFPNSFFRDLWSCRSLASLRNLSFWVKV